MKRDGDMLKIKHYILYIKQKITRDKQTRTLAQSWSNQIDLNYISYVASCS